MKGQNDPKNNDTKTQLFKVMTPKNKTCICIVISKLIISRQNIQQAFLYVVKAAMTTAVQISVSQLSPLAVIGI